MFNGNKRIIYIAAAVAFLLLIPFVAMRFTDEVKWNFFDFAVAAVLLFGTGLAIDLVLRFVKETWQRLALCVAVLIVFALVWIELAVGLFGTPFAGS